MNTSKKIKDILDRKVILEENIRQSKNILCHCAMSGIVGAFTQSNSRYDININKEFFHDAIEKQIALDGEELSSINKKLDAIASLMGVAE